MALMVRRVIEAGAVLGLKPSRQAVLIVLAEHVDHNSGAHESWPNFATIMLETRLSKSTVERSVSDLVEHGLITRHRKKSGEWITRFVVEKIDALGERYSVLKEAHNDEIEQVEHARNAKKKVRRKLRGDEPDPVTKGGSERKLPRQSDVVLPRQSDGPDPVREGGITSNTTSNELGTLPSPLSDLQRADQENGSDGAAEAEVVRQICASIGSRQNRARFDQGIRAEILARLRQGHTQLAIVDHVADRNWNGVQNPLAFMMGILQQMATEPIAPPAAKKAEPIDCTHPGCWNSRVSIEDESGEWISHPCPECNEETAHLRKAS